MWRTRAIRGLLGEIIDLVRDDAQMVGCLVEVKRACDIVDNGTSAHNQVAIYEKAKSDGAEKRVALATAVDWLAVETLIQ